MTLEGQNKDRNPAARLVGTILAHDRKVNTYKLALIRSLNDTVLFHPDLSERDVAVPLRVLAERWISYYWPFSDPGRPVYQGPRANRSGGEASDIAFRPELTRLRGAWETYLGESRASDGFLLSAEMRIPRIAGSYPPEIVQAFVESRRKIVGALRQPIRYAGPGGETHGVFPPVARAGSLPGLSGVGEAPLALPGTAATEPCVLVRGELWRAFRELSLWVEALCIHEWSLFTEALRGSGADRGETYALLTDRPDNRRPLTWERNQVELLMLEDHRFVCPWTGRLLGSESYALDHVIPVSVYPTNELWNLVPSDPRFNAHTKRARIPTAARMRDSLPLLSQTYANYALSPALGPALDSDLAGRFGLSDVSSPERIANAVAGAALSVAEARGVERF